MTALIATSVVRGSRQGESHGGVYLVDLEQRRVHQTIDWNTAEIDWQGRGWDRGLRGIAFDGDRVFIAASDELFVFSPRFEKLASYRNPYLKHCHEITVYQRRLYLSSTGFDSVLGFDLDRNVFSWGLQLSPDRYGLFGTPFDPNQADGPQPGNSLHLNNVVATDRGLFMSGLRSHGLHRFDGRQIGRVADLPGGTHNARPYRGGVLFNDTERDVVCFRAQSGRELEFALPRYEEDELTHANLDDSRVARQGFGRGLCLVGRRVVAAGSSPSTISLHNLDTGKSLGSVTLSLDIRNAIHGLEVWPFGIS